MQQDRAHVRLLILAAVALFWMTAVFGRVAYLQLFRHSDYLARASRQQRRVIEITPKRGAIYDRNMHPLAMSVPVQSAFAVPSEMKDVTMPARLLSGVLAIPQDVLRQKLDGGGSFVWIQRKLPPEKAEAVKSLNLKGVYFQEENQRYYPKRDLAAHVLGFVDVDEKGLGGIEHEYDNVIRGKGEKIVVMADARQRWFDGGEAQRERGTSVVLTLDEKGAVHRRARTGRSDREDSRHRRHRHRAGPNTGAILALANWPKFNPNAAADAPAEARMNRAISAIYEPGSTFKLVTLAAAFDQNLTRPDEVFDCENGSLVVGGRRIHDHKAYGMLTVSEILANSSDVGAMKIALRLGAPKFYEYIRAFGFGTPTGVDLPGESRGLLERLQHWVPSSIGAISMGQEVGVTPLQMVTAVSAVANGGLLYKPHTVQQMMRGEQILPLDGPSAPAEPRRVIRPETAATLRHLMEGVILHGTGKTARLDGWTAGGKTGTAQKIDPATGRYSRTNVIASFTGFAPINNPGGHDSGLPRFSRGIAARRRGRGGAGIQADSGTSLAVSGCAARCAREPAPGADGVSPRAQARRASRSMIWRPWISTPKRKPRATELKESPAKNPEPEVAGSDGGRGRGRRHLRAGLYRENDARSNGGVFAAGT